MEHAEVRYVSGKKFIARNRAHTVTIDLPEGFGGKDEGPTPPEIFMDSLASCVGVYVVGYCNRAGLNTEGLTISVDWKKELKEKPYYIKKIDVKIALPNAEVGSRKEELLSIANSCLIHETLERKPQVNIELA